MKLDTSRLKSLKPFLFLFAIIYAIVITLGSTLAWFSASDDKINNFKSDLNLFSAETVDLFDPANPWKPDNKQVSAINTGEKPAFVRILVLPTLLKGSTPIQARIGDEIIVSFLDIRSPSNPSGLWLYGDDGYYYFLDVLDPGQTAHPFLFKNVSLSPSLPADYNLAVLNIEVKMEAVSISSLQYRIAWWNNPSPPSSSPLSTIDSILAPLAS